MITIGKMSLACHVSIKTLRYYDKIGLLRPALVDADTGYRFYSANQIGEMVQINRYKRFGFSLAEIQELVRADLPDRKIMLEKQKRLLQEQILSLKLTVQDLDVVLERLKINQEERKMNDYSVELISVPRQNVISRRQIMSVGDFGTVFGELFEEIAKKGILKTGLTGARYYDADFDQAASDIEAFILTDDPAAANDFIGGDLCARTVHRGGYSTLSEAYAALVLWIEENGYESAGAPFELYTKTGFDNLAPSKWETEIYFPLRKKQQNNR